MHVCSDSPVSLVRADMTHPYADMTHMQTWEDMTHSYVDMTHSYADMTSMHTRPMPAVRAPQHDHVWHQCNDNVRAGVRDIKMIEFVNACVLWPTCASSSRAAAWSRVASFERSMSVRLNSSTYRSSHVTHMNESCHTFYCVVSRIWMRRITHTHLNSSIHRWTHHVTHVTHMNESYDTHASVMSHVWVGVCVCVCMCICVCVCVCVDVCMCVWVGPVTRVNEWCHFFCKMRHILNGPWAQK